MTRDLPEDLNLNFKQLKSRYGVGDSVMKKRVSGMKAIGMALEKDATGRLYASGDRLKVLDEMDDWVKNSGTVPDFCEMKLKEQGVSVAPETTRMKGSLAGRSTQDAALAFESLDVKAELIALAQEGLTLRICYEANIMTPRRILREAAEFGEVLTTGELAELLGFNASTISRKGKKFSWRGYEFTRAGKDVEILWEVKKKESRETSSQDT